MPRGSTANSTARRKQFGLPCHVQPRPPMSGSFGRQIAGWDLLATSTSRDQQHRRGARKAGSSVVNWYVYHQPSMFLVIRDLQHTYSDQTELHMVISANSWFSRFVHVFRATPCSRCWTRPVYSDTRSSLSSTKCIQLGIMPCCTIRFLC